MQSSHLSYLCTATQGIVQDPGLCSLSCMLWPTLSRFLLLTCIQMETKYVIFTDDQTKRYEDFVDQDFEQTDEGLGIKFQKQEIYADTFLLLRYNCPEENCEEACYGWPGLHKHVRNIHHKIMCDLCTRNKKVFTHEHELFTTQQLRKHERFGDDNPGAIDQSGFRGHPECGFCKMRFYGDDELFTHCREKHERCHICDRRSSARQPQYYVNYDALEEHFRKDHFLCLDPKCQEAKFVVFESEMDLKAHQLAEHSNDISRDVRRDVRTVDMSSFAFRAPYQEPRVRRGGVRGRDPNSEPIPPSSAQPMRRDEVAYQRQREIQSAQSVRTRAFGGQLTSSTNGANAGNVSSGRAQTSDTPNMESLSINQPSQVSSANSTATSSLQDQARQMQHDAVTARASSMLNHDQTKIADFRTSVSSYKSSAITATQLVDTLLALFDSSPADLGTLIKELAALYDNEAKHVGLLKAWNDWCAINEDYPFLPGPAAGTSPATATDGAGSRRILKLKSSTAQSSRSATNRQNSWGRTASPATKPTTTTTGPRVGASMPWAAPSSSRHAAPRVSRPAIAPTPAASIEAFPALPLAAKPNTAIWGLHNGRVMWDDRRPLPTNAWGGASEAASDAEAEEGGKGEAGTGEAGTGGGKKKGRKKQTLYKFG